MTGKVWKDGKNGGTPITAAELNRIERAIEARAASDDVAQLRELFAELVSRVDVLEADPSEGNGERVDESVARLFRSMGFGWEDTSNARDWSAIVGQLSEDGFNAVDLAVGRPSWSLAPELEGTSWRSSDPSRSFADVIAQARAGGAERVYLTVDCFMPDYLVDHPEWKSISRDGTVRDDIPSAAAWANELPGQVMEDYLRDLAGLYGGQIDGIVLTELHWDSGSFTDADLELFKAAMGKSDWTRRADGSPHVGPDEQAWLGEMMAANVARWQVAAGDVPLIADVRVDWENPTVGNLSSGHDYAKLLGAADGGLSLWAYFKEEAPEQVGPLRAAIEQRWPEKVRLSLGLWGSGGADITPEALQRAVSALAGYPDVQITPYSKYIAGTLANT